MAKDRTFTPTCFYTHEGKPLEPGKTYTVSDVGSGELVITSRAADDLEGQEQRMQATRDEEARVEAERRQLAYGNVDFNGVPVAHTPAGLSQEDVARMIDEALKVDRAARAAAEMEENPDDKKDGKKDENSGENQGSGDGGGSDKTEGTTEGSAPARKLNLGS